MNRINLKELAELNVVENYYRLGSYKRELKLKNHLNECGLKWFYVELNNHNNIDEFADEIIVCNFDSNLKDKLSESGIVYDEYCCKNHLDIKLYEDIKNDVIQTKYAKSIGYLYLIQDNATYEVDVIVKKNENKVDVMLDFTYITKIDDDEVPQVTPERFLLLYGFNCKEYFVYDEIEDVYYMLNDMLNDELKDRETDKEREELIREDTSWFIDKDVFSEDCDL